MLHERVNDYITQRKEKIGVLKVIVEKEQETERLRSVVYLVITYEK